MCGDRSLGVRCPGNDAHSGVASDRLRRRERRNLLGRWSPECTGAEWLSEKRGAGALFVGHNRSDGRTWTTECEVVIADRPTEFTWHVLTNTEPMTSIWRFHIQAVAEGTSVTETFEMRAPPRPFLAAARHDRRSALLERRKRELQSGIWETLGRLKADIEHPSQIG